MATKICTKCYIEKELDEFYERKNSKDGRRNECVQCLLIVARNRLAKNRESNKIVDLSGFKTCITCLKLKSKTEFDMILQMKGGISNQCKICRRLVQQNHCKFNIEKNQEIDMSGIKKCSQCHVIKPKTEFHIDRRNLHGIMCYCKECMNNNLQRRFHINLNHRIKKVLKGKNKSKHTMDLLGCDINFFIEWMKYQFEGNMT